MADRIDIERLSVAELESIRNEVLRVLATRHLAAQGPTPVGSHDKHSSQHGKNTNEVADIGGELLNPIRLPGEAALGETSSE